MVDLLFNAAMVPADLLALVLVARLGHGGALRAAAGVTLGAAVAAASCLALAVLFVAGLGWNPLFATLRFAAWGLFLHGPLLCVAGACVLRRRAWQVGLAAAAAVLSAVAFEAFVRGPRALELQRLVVTSATVAAPLRIGVLADLQTDRVGAYERRAIELLMAEEPDLILLPGDYVHVLDDALRVRQWDALRALLAEVGLRAPLGVHAVAGDVDSPGWERAFAGLGVETYTATHSVRRGDVTVTGLSYADGASPSLSLAGAAGFHVAFAHRPDFALGAVDADLLVAGHTHGGQVRLPFLGPLLTLSAVPRAWAAGRTDLPGGRTLVVSRGVGMERGHAPRLRFLCPPEVVVIEVVPAAPTR